MTVKHHCNESILLGKPNHTMYLCNSPMCTFSICAIHMSQQGASCTLIYLIFHRNYEFSTPNPCMPNKKRNRTYNTRGGRGVGGGVCSWKFRHKANSSWTVFSTNGMNHLQWCMNKLATGMIQQNQRMWCKSSQTLLHVAGWDWWQHCQCNFEEDVKRCCCLQSVSTVPLAQ